MKKNLTWGILLVVCLASFFILRSDFVEFKTNKIAGDWTLKELGDHYGIKPGELKKQLKYHYDVKREMYGSTRIRELEISGKQLSELLSRIGKESSPSAFILKITIWFLGLGLVLQYVLTIRNKKKINKIHGN